MTSSSIEIAGHAIGLGHPPFVIAEAGVNHNGDPELARRLIDAAADAGADAVKFQTYEATALATAHAERAAYQRDPSGSDSQLAMLQQLELARGTWAELAAVPVCTPLHAHPPTCTYTLPPTPRPGLGEGPAGGRREGASSWMGGFPPPSGSPG